MNIRNKNNFLVSVVYGSIISVIFVVLVTILGELIPPIKDFLKEQHDHHWIGKGIWTMSIFAGASALFSLLSRSSVYSDEQLAKWIRILSWCTIAGVFVLFFFFGYEYVIKH